MEKKPNVKQFNVKANHDMMKTLNTDGITLEVGSEAKIHLDCNPTTGYNWLIDKEDKTTNGKFSIDDSYKRDDADAMSMGVGGTSYITLKGLEEGEGMLKAVYARSWEFNVTDWDNEENKGMNQIKAKIVVKKAEVKADTPGEEGKDEAATTDNAD